jgi:hypothetical protein
MAFRSTGAPDGFRPYANQIATSEAQRARSDYWRPDSKGGSWAGTFSPQAQQLIDGSFKYTSEAGATGAPQTEVVRLADPIQRSALDGSTFYNTITANDNRTFNPLGERDYANFAAELGRKTFDYQADELKDQQKWGLESAMEMLEKLRSPGNKDSNDNSSDSSGNRYNINESWRS